MPVNAVEILVAAFANFLIGYLWYSPMLFGKVWAKEMSKNKPTIKMHIAITGSFLVGLVMAAVLAYFLDLTGTVSIMDALIKAKLFWLGFAFPVYTLGLLFAGRKFTGYLIDISYNLVVLEVMAVLIILL